MTESETAAVNELLNSGNDIGSNETLISILGGGLTVRTGEIMDVTILDLEGEIRRSNGDGPTLHPFVTAELGKGKRNFVFSFQGVKFVDSFGVGEIQASYTAVKNLGGKLKLASLSKKIHFLFSVCVITPPWLMWPEMGAPYETAEAALESFGGS